MNRYIALLGFIVVVLGGGLLIGYLTLPGEWYAGLAKPFFNPPNWIFGPVWSVLYLLIAIAGWRVWLRDPHGVAMRIWIAQLVLNFLWSPTFFGLQQMGLGLLVILALLVAIVGFMATAAKVDRLAGWLFAPYAAWVAFATLLNASLWWLN
ncbi:tryptophan-rich sensory protein [Aminobacter anthyllidis]|uniref:TspO/MBR family protein n=1 Tax=Aminobacter anthyllidis TaxID=1035067 RepID=UPI002458FC3E|nr:tryptophan-rich sensory protein [Aminobacter anthyllidis]MDH4986015.1 tryptophan-rich sensory protein [Aminobacter anthyllidis]